MALVLLPFPGYTGGMKFRAATLVILSCCLAVSSCSQRRGNPTDAGSVWVVESASTRLYLCGTIHLLRAQDYPLPAAYDSAYAASQRLVFELPPGADKGAQLAKQMADAGRIRDGRNLFDLVDQKTADATRAWARKRGVSMDLMRAFQPWFAALTVAATEYQAAGAEPGRGVDVFFENKAAQDGKPGEGLETVQQQIALFSELPEARQTELLTQTLAEVEALSGQFGDMVAAWRSGNIDALNKLLFEEAEEYPDLMEVFLFRRNEAWISRLEQHLAGKDTVMVLVGAGHLGGERGLIELLTNRGYRVKPYTAVP